MPDGNGTTTETRVPPCDTAAEELVLAHALAYGTEPFPTLRGQHFYSTTNGWIYEAIRELEADQEPVDAVSVARRLRESNKLSAVGGAKYIVEIVSFIPDSSRPFAVSHANAIIELWKRRVLLATAQTIVAELYGGGLSSAETWTRFKEVCDAQRQAFV